MNCSVIYLFNRNSSGNITADITLHFGQDVRMRHFTTLYEAFYVHGRLGNITVKPLMDTSKLLEYR